MLITEAEAKKKDCPFGALQVVASVQCGETPSDWSAWIKCTGSDCMAWRWYKGSLTRAKGRGFCGLAGKPGGGE